jgi:hypothetical protein
MPTMRSTVPIAKSRVSTDRTKNFRFGPLLGRMNTSQPDSRCEPLVKFAEERGRCLEYWYRGIWATFRTVRPLASEPMSTQPLSVLIVPTVARSVGMVAGCAVLSLCSAATRSFACSAHCSSPRHDFRFYLRSTFVTVRPCLPPVCHCPVRIQRANASAHCG